MRAVLHAKSISNDGATPFTGDFQLARAEYVLGRASNCDLVIPRRTVSKQHAKFFLREGDRYVVEDMGSRSGVVVNSERVVQRELAAGDKILIGDVLMTYEVVDSAPTGFGQEGFEDNPFAEADSDGASAEFATRQFTPDEVRSGLREAPPPPPETISVPAPSQDGSGDSGEEFELKPFSPFATRKKRKGAASKDFYTRLRAEVHADLVRRSELRRDTFENVPDEEMWNKVATAANQIIYTLQKDGRIPPEVDARHLLKDILQDALGLGPIQDFLEDAAIEEIMVNGPDHIYIARHGKTVLTDKKFIDEEKLLTAINRITAPLGRSVNQSRPMVDARLADGSRINAIIAPVSLIGPVLTIRKFPEKPLTPDDLANYGSVSRGMLEFLNFAVVQRKNILVAGGTAAGKTTLLNVLSSFIPPDDRIVTIEDSAELQLQQPHVISLETRPSNSDGAMDITIRELVKNSLRMRPDRIIVGECRGGEAVDMLQAMNTGHDGSLTTGHANSAFDMLTRLETMVMMAGLEIPLHAIRQQIARAIDLVVYIERFVDGKRRLAQIIEVLGVDEDGYQAHEIFRFNAQIQPDGGIRGSFDPTGYIPEFMREIKERGGQIPLEIFTPTAIQ